MPAPWLTTPEPCATAWLRRRQAWLAAALLAARAGLASAHAGRTGVTPAVVPVAGLTAILCAAVQGGCLWWVARRQIGPWAGLLALALYLASPVWRAGEQMAVALLLFVLLYTAAGVAHAVQGPRHKWPPRLALLGVLVMAAALLSPVAAAFSLALGLGCMLYLGQGRRLLLTAVVAAAAAVATIAALLRPTGAGVSAPVGPAPWGFWAGDILAALVALGIWAAHRRSRFFGNTAPLLASVVFLVTGHAVWALAPALLFIAGAFADAQGLPLQRRRNLACVSALVCVVVQWTLACRIR